MCMSESLRDLSSFVLVGAGVVSRGGTSVETGGTEGWSGGVSSMRTSRETNTRFEDGL